MRTVVGANNLSSVLDALSLFHRNIGFLYHLDSVYLVELVVMRDQVVILWCFYIWRP